MVLVNGQLDGSILATDRGLAYGDGVFRTMLLHQSKILHWSRHYAKLVADCVRLNLRCPAEALLRQDVLVCAEKQHQGVIKIIITRGSGQRGYGYVEGMHVTRVVTYSNLPQYPAHNLTQGVKARLCTLRLAQQAYLAGVKHLNRLEQVLARAEWQDAEIAEGIMLDQTGNVIGGVMSNLFVVHGQTLTTPSVESCGVAGVTRERIMDLAPTLQLRLKIGILSLEALFAADEVMLCNSVNGIWPVRQLEHQCWPVGRVTQCLQNTLRNDDHATI